MDQISCICISQWNKQSIWYHDMAFIYIVVHVSSMESEFLFMYVKFCEIDYVFIF